MELTHSLIVEACFLRLLWENIAVGKNRLPTRCSSLVRDPTVPRLQSETTSVETLTVETLYIASLRTPVAFQASSVVSQRLCQQPPDIFASQWPGIVLE